MSRQGFTIVELLIVIVVIAILASISIVAYNGIQNRAADTAIKSDVRNFANKVEQHNVINGNYPSTSDTVLETLEYKATRSAYKDANNGQTGGYNLGYCVNSSTNEYVFYAISPSGNAFRAMTGGRIESLAPVGGGGYAICNMVNVPTTNPNWGRRTDTNSWDSWL